VRRGALLLVMALAAVLVEGYHFGVDDAGIYIPAIVRFAHPQLYPFGEEFFLSHGHASIFAAVAGGVARGFHVSVAGSVLSCYLLGTWLLLLAGWEMSKLCFEGTCARWCAVGALAAMLPVQVAGTAIPIMDNYFTARTLSTPLTLLALVMGLRGWWRSAVVCIGFTLFLHPQMSFYAAVLLAGIALPQLWQVRRPTPEAVRALPVLLLSLGSFSSISALFPAGPASGSYREAMYSRTYMFAANWSAAEWVGVLFPLLILLAFSLYSPQDMRLAVRRLCAATAAAGVLATLIFLLLSSSPRFDSLLRLQPMRLFQLAYIVMFLLLGGLVGEYVIRGRAWRAVVLFLPLAVGMYALDRHMYPASLHLELPHRRSANPWLQAFDWIRRNTPENAVFALDPDYLRLPGEDGHGFRALTRRSSLADSYKDSGVATMFPAVAPEWGREVQAQHGWRSFHRADFERLAARYPVSWVVVDAGQAQGLECPYLNPTLAVCRLSPAAPDPAPGD
jgi:hypothetical protein